MDCTAEVGTVGFFKKVDGTEESHDTHNTDNTDGAAELDTASIIKEGKQWNFVSFSLC